MITSFRPFYWISLRIQGLYGELDPDEFPLGFGTIEEDGVGLRGVVTSIQHDRFHHSNGMAIDSKYVDDSNMTEMSATPSCS